MAVETVKRGRRARAWRFVSAARVGAALVAIVSCSTPAFAEQAENAGRAVVVSGAGSTRALSGGGSTTEFSIELPRGASCPGDSANDDYRVQSYMVPETLAPAAVQYDGLGPAPSAVGNWPAFRQPLYATSTRAFASEVTADATAPGQPGAIVNIPALTFAVYAPGELPAGRYHVGIACTLLNQPVRYWDTEVVVADAPGDKPAAITWAVADANGAPKGSNRLAVAAMVTAVAIAGAAAVLYARRRLPARSSTDSTEDR